LDLGGTFLKYALGTREGEILLKDKKPSEADQPRAAVFRVMFEAIDEMVKAGAEFQGVVRAIGCGSPGSVDFDRGKLLGNTPNITDWGNADIRGEIEGRFGLPTWVDNDANVMTLAEAECGAAKGFRHVIAITLGTGIGGGIMVNGSIYRGGHYAGAELGHVSVQFDGLACNCGGRGCIEQYASAPAMVRNYMEKLRQKSRDVSQTVTTKTIFTQAAKGEQEAIKTIDETCEYLGAALASIVNIFNPEIIVIGGGVADAGDEFIAQIWSALKSRAMPPSLKGLRLVHAELGNDAGVVGAIRLAACMYDRIEKGPCE
jgi:glucokinase